MKTVITYGVFDLFHEGHVNLLRRAKELGDRLIVGVSSSQFTRQRGKLLLADSLNTRMNNVRNCPYVDEVILEDHYGQKIEDVQKYHADIFVAGDDWTGKFDFLKKWCEVVYLTRTPGISSSSLRSAPYPRINFGIIGSGRAANKFMQEIGFVRGGLHAVKIFNPSLDSAKRFADQYPELEITTSPEEMFRDVDAVYIASPHETHYAYAKSALLSGKHVLCEKPIALNKAEASDLFDTAKKMKVVFMDAIKTAYAPGFVHLLSIVQSGFIGEIRDIECAFTKLVPQGLREWTDRTYGGAFTEMASYTLLPVLKLIGTEDLDVRFECHLDENGVDAYTKTYISGKGITSCGKCGIGVKTEGEMIIAGTTGYIKVVAPWWMTSCFEIHHEDPNRIEHFTYDFEGYGFRYEIAKFVERIQGWHDSDFNLTRKESETIAELHDRFLQYRNALRRKSR